MTGREKMEAALSPSGSPECPAVLCYEWIYWRDHWPRLTSCPWWYAEEPDVDRQMRMLRDLVGMSGEDGFDLPVFYSNEDRANLFIEAQGSRVFLCDRRTGRRRELEEPQVAGGSSSGECASPHPDSGPETPDEVDAAIPLPPDFDEAAFKASRAGGLAERMLAEFGHLFPLGGVAAPLWNCYGLWGYERLMTNVAGEPELVRRACERFLAGGIHRIRQAAAVGTRGIWLEDCMTDSISPRDWRTLHLPYVRTLVEEIRRCGMKSIHYYCGNPADRWDLLLDTNADALALEESKKGFVVDIDEVVERVGGRMTVFGNLDAINVLPRAADDELRREIARQLAAGRRNGGRFVMSLGSPVTPGTLVERVRRYCELAHGG